MRTTLDLPGELLRRAEAEAMERGIALDELVKQALTVELGRSPEPSPRNRARFPLFSSHQPGSLDLSNADIAESENAEDRRRGATPD